MARGHIRRRSDDSWTLVVDLERDAVTGKRRQKWATYHGTKRDAEKRLAEMVVEAERGTLGASPKLTIAEYFERWLKDHAEANTTPKTLDRYRRLIQNNIVPYLGRVRLDRLKPAMIATWHTKLREAPRRDGKEGSLSSTSRKQAHAVLHRALEDAVKWGLIPLNPASNVDSPQPAHHEMATFDAEQAIAFLEALEPEGTFWKTFFYVMMTAGLRLSEVVGLRWRDLDLNAGTLAVQQTIYRLPKVGIIVKGAKSRAGRRPVVLDSEAVRLLRLHKESQAETRGRLGSAWKDNDLVFPGPLGEPIGEHPIRRVFRQTCQRASLPRIRLHDLRHTSATLLLTAGIHPKVVSERLGHSTISITLNLYSHVSKTLQQDAADKLGEMLRRPVEDTAKEDEEIR